MDIFDRLLEDHDTLRELLDRLADLWPAESTRRGQLVDALKKELDSHIEGEEQVLYPALLDGKRTREGTLGGLEEHRAMSWLVGELLALPPDHERWAPRLAVLAQLVEHHLDQEEDELFEEGHEVLPEARAEEMVPEYEAIKDAGLRRAMGVD